MRLLALAFLWGAAAVHAGENQWEMVPGQSQLRFTATYEGQPAPGEFKDFGVDLRFRPQAPERGRLVVAVRLDSADMGDARVNRTIRDPVWLAVAQESQAVFTSAAIRRRGEGRFVAKGKLRLKGVEKSLEVPFRWRREGEQAVMTGRFTVRRTRFRIGTGQWSEGGTIGLDVRVRFRVTLRPGGGQ